MELQQKISKQKMKEKIGQTYETLIEAITTDGKYYIGRSYMDVPDMDGFVYIKANEKIKIGEFVKCTITQTNGDYDLVARVSGE